MINKVKAIVKDRILTTLGTIVILVGIYMLVFQDITDTKLVIVFVVGLGFIIAPEKLLDKLKP